MNVQGSFETGKFRGKINNRGILYNDSILFVERVLTKTLYRERKQNDLLKYDG